MQMERKIFWIVVSILGLLVVTVLPLLWALAAIAPIVVIAWWIGYETPWLRRHIPFDKHASDSRHDTTGKHAA